MGSIIVCGGSMIGLSTALMLARDGHQVTVLEADPDGAPSTPAGAWEDWKRKGVAQFRQPHNLFARFRRVCDEELPGMTERLLAAGCVWVDYLSKTPPTVTNWEPQPGDEEFRYVTGRRPVIESVFAAAAEEQPGITIRRGTKVRELRTGRSAVPGVPHVVGVRTADGEELDADLVVDAMGRRSPTADLLAAIGAREPVAEAEDSGFVYYTRYFTGSERPSLRGTPLTPLGSLSVLTLDGDNDTWSVTLYAANHDKPLKALRDTDCFTRAVSAMPLQAHWLDGKPITDVLPMAGILDRYHRFVVDGSPVVTGYAAVGDSWACTNPSAGRGLSVGIVHAQVLRRTVREHLGDPGAFALAWDKGTEETAAPFYWNQIAADRVRIAEMDALRDGTTPPPADSPLARLHAAASYDATLFRAGLEVVLCMSLPQEVLARPGILDIIDRNRQQDAAPGPDRAQLLELLSA
jgi:2-polyprenyl-6-methoxyphenol hydroxylase-like FAD-dependent oxidoreductase